MKFFNKKKNNTDNDSSSLNKITSNEVRIIIVGAVEDTPVQESSFIAKIIIDKLDGVKYMINEDKNFRHLYPERDDLYTFTVQGKTINEKKKWLKEEIKRLKQNLKDYLKNPTKNINEKDIELKIKIYETRLLELERGLDKYEGSPVYIGDKGLRTFFFYRTSGELIPLRWDLRGQTIYKDIAYKKKQSVVAYQNVLSKYNTKLKKFVEAGTIWMLFILVIWTVALIFGSGYLFNKYRDFNSMYDESEIVKLKTQAERSVLFCGDVLQSQLKVMKNLTELNKENLDLQNKFIINRNIQTKNSINVTEVK